MFKMKKQFELNNSTVFLGECSEAGEDYEKLDESFSEELRSEQERGHLLISQLALDFDFLINHFAPHFNWCDF